MLAVSKLINTDVHEPCRLLEAAKEVLKHNAERYSEIVETIREDHLKAIREAIAEGTHLEGSILEDVERDVNAECDRLKSFMSAADVRCSHCRVRNAGQGI